MIEQINSNYGNKCKPNRLKGYDYSSGGVYFLTVCIKQRKIILSNYGIAVEKHIKIMNSEYENIRVEKYIIMPNHIHLLIHISGMMTFGSSQAPNPTNAIIPKFVFLFKRYTNKEIGQNIWQRSYYDHIIRDESDYITHLEYIGNNPQKWLAGKDEYYV